MIYAFDEQNQLYAGFSPEAGSHLHLITWWIFGDDPGDSLEFTPLEPQQAWTAEIGSRGESGRFGWELSLYHSWVRNELLDVNDAFGVDREEASTLPAPTIRELRRVWRSSC